MKRIVLNDALIPRWLARAHRDYANWDEFTRSANGQKLRQLKSDEQHGFCGYCECRLADANGVLPLRVSHADHFYRKNKYPAKMYSWDNLILSCKQNDSCGVFKDRDKQTIPSEQLLNPVEEDPRDYFSYTLVEEKYKLFITPIVSLPDDERKKAQNTIDALNLNCDRLCQERAKEWFKYKDTVEEFFLKRLQTGEMQEAEQEELLQEMEQGEYSSAMVCMARDSW